MLNNLNTRLDDEALYAAADEYLRLKRQANAINDRMGELAETLIASGFDEVSGYEATVNIQHVESNNVSWRSVAMAAGATPRQIERYTSVKAYDRVVARQRDDLVEVA